MLSPQGIEDAVRRVTDQGTFVRELLVGSLGWPIDSTNALGAIAYEWTADELHVAGLERHIVDGTAHQIVLPGNPWGIFVLEFKNADVFTTGRGMIGILRSVFQRMTAGNRRAAAATVPTFQSNSLLFICSHGYRYYRFCYFRPVSEDSRRPRMVSFGWGPEDQHAMRTICEFNLRALAWPEREPSGHREWIRVWAAAFDVDRVTKRFFEDYARVFSNVERHVAIQGLQGDELRLFTQALLNRLMFLRFIECKNWLRFPGQHGTRYLAALSAAGGVDNDSVYQSRIRPLFFAGLADRGQHTSVLYGSVPFLNGGLFTESSLDRRVTDLPDESLDEVIGPRGLFYRYNFTVEESTPFDVDIAVDPEMLGKVFEELVIRRHQQGSYYTPRPVVAFMCREALKGYLRDHCNVSMASIERLIDDHDDQGLGTIEIKQIVQALDDMRAVDPACGSGAYLLGMLQELVTVRRRLADDGGTGRLKSRLQR